MGPPSESILEFESLNDISESPDPTLWAVSQLNSLEFRTQRIDSESILEFESLIDNSESPDPTL